MTRISEHMTDLFVGEKNPMNVDRQCLEDKQKALRDIPRNEGILTRKVQDSGLLKGAKGAKRAEGGYGDSAEGG